MPLSVEEFRDLIRLLEERPEWRAELRRLLLTDEPLVLPQLVRELVEAVSRLAEAQARTEARVTELVEAQARTEARVTELAEAQARTEAGVMRLGEAQARTDQVLGVLATRMDQLAEAERRTEERLEELAAAQRRTEERLEELATAQRRTEERLEELAAAQRRTEERLEELATAQRRTEERLEELATAQARTEAQVTRLADQVTRLVDEVGGLKGRSLEGEYREKAAGFFQRLLRRIRLVPREELEALADDGEDRGLLSPQEHEGLLYADAVLKGQWRDGRAETYLVAEVSSVVDLGDVERAVNRAGLLARVTPARVVAAVAGERITEEADREARRLGVWRVLNGRSLSPDT